MQLNCIKVKKPWAIAGTQDQSSDLHPKNRLEYPHPVLWNASMVTLSDVQSAQTRIAPYIRQTPVLSALGLQQSPCPEAQLQLKLENLQVTGAFKVRGALNTLLSLTPADLSRGVVTASGGNHGLAVAYAAWTAQVPAKIFLPANVPASKGKKLEQWGAEVVWHGDVWDDANHAALDLAERTGMAYIHPFADPMVIAGQGTLALELAVQAPAATTLVVAIGGGGLISGVAAAAKLINPAIRIIGVEPTGAPTLYESVKANGVVTLPTITTAANTLAPCQSTPLNLSLVQQYVDDIVLVTDDEMRDAARWLWFECGIAAELSGAAAMAAIAQRRFPIAEGDRLCALVCGAGTDGLD
jgi:threonine dehydratase